jgi:hypothetical protein
MDCNDLFDHRVGKGEIGRITSHALLGGLHHHYMRV